MRTKIGELVAALNFAADHCKKVAAEIETYGETAVSGGVGHPTYMVATYIADRIEKGEVVALSVWLQEIEQEVVHILMLRGYNTSEKLMNILRLPSQEAVRQWLFRRHLTLKKRPSNKMRGGF